MEELLHVVRIYGGYAVMLAEGTRLENSDLEPGTILAAFPTAAGAERYAQWLSILRAGYHGALPAYL